MSWFEQATSRIRCSIIQFHRPVKLKLRRRCKEGIYILVYSYRIYEFFYSLYGIERMCLLWKVIVADVVGYQNGCIYGKWQDLFICDSILLNI